MAFGAPATKRPKNYWVVDPDNPKGDRYPAKAIAGNASGQKCSDFNGGVTGANRWLENAGFEIVADKKKRSDPKNAPTSLGETEAASIGLRRRGQNKFRKALVDYWRVVVA